MLLTRDAKCVLSRLRDLAALYASCAHAHATRAALRELRSDRLQIWIKAARGAIVGMRNTIAGLRTFATDFTAFRHITSGTHASCVQLN